MYLFWWRTSRFVKKNCWVEKWKYKLRSLLSWSFAHHETAGSVAGCLKKKIRISTSSKHCLFPNLVIVWHGGIDRWELGKCYLIWALPDHSEQESSYFISATWTPGALPKNSFCSGRMNQSFITHTFKSWSKSILQDLQMKADSKVLANVPNVDDGRGKDETHMVKTTQDEVLQSPVQASIAKVTFAN